jgi:hypothetical protein
VRFARGEHGGKTAPETCRSSGFRSGIHPATTKLSGVTDQREASTVSLEGSWGLPILIARLSIFRSPSIFALKTPFAWMIRAMQPVHPV